MGGLLRRVDPGSWTEGPGCRGWVVGEVRYHHTAAKFWPTLLDEIAEVFPGGVRMELSADGSGRLGARHLYPERAFQEDLQRLLDSGADLAREIHNTFLELDLTGPPPPVRIRIFDGDGEALYGGTLPTDAVDGEIFLVLVAWPLKWSDIPESEWNAERLEGGFRGEDRERGRVYEVRFSLTTRHLSEGLYRRKFSFSFAKGGMS